MAENSSGIRDSNGERMPASPGSKDRGMVEEKRKKAAKEPKHPFRSLGRLIDLQMLYESFRSLKRKAAPGVDGVVVAGYSSRVRKLIRLLSLDRNDLK